MPETIRPLKKINIFTRLRFSRRSPRLIFTNKALFLLLLFVFSSFIYWRFLRKPESTSTSANSSNTSTGLTTREPAVDLGKEFTFPIQDTNGREITKLVYTIDSAQLAGSVVVQGQRANAVEGRKFLVLVLKLINDSNQTVNLNTRNYVRLSTNGKTDWLAGDIHNDPVEVQPISTKFTRLGFAVDGQVKNFKIQVGEINGEKTVFDLNF